MIRSANFSPVPTDAMGRPNHTVLLDAFDPVSAAGVDAVLVLVGHLCLVHLG